MSNEDNLQEPLLEDSTLPQSESGNIINTGSKKRKRTKGQGQEDSKNKESAKRKKPKPSEDEDIDVEAGVNLAIAKMDNHLLADYIARQTRRYENDLSSVELEDKYLPVTAIRDTTSWSKPRTLDNLPEFLEKFAENPTKLWSASKKNGSPHTIIVTSAGLRAADIARAVRNFQTKDVKVAKLFAKHIKIKESIAFLKSTRTGIAVGTPQRLQDLMDDGQHISFLPVAYVLTCVFAIDRLERIIIDASHIDQKRRGILEMKETQVPLIKWLGASTFRERYEGSKDRLQIFFY
ncbi:Replication regulator protein [Rutstroemia sp. NJR-2017a WRK4]|nr:Replication regulator protein [Rutstroemia sp. NJR-2017a WRK4]